MIKITSWSKTTKDRCLYFGKIGIITMASLALPAFFSSCDTVTINFNVSECVQGQYNVIENGVSKRAGYRRAKSSRCGRLRNEQQSLAKGKNYTVTWYCSNIDGEQRTSFTTSSSRTVTIACPDS